uniref:(northern house mosquito) hypothetical protein n=1 Tax=Culex pipiens TaxID=7175 RepID=A0A8D8F2N1_CULPI
MFQSLNLFIFFKLHAVVASFRHNLSGRTVFEEKLWVQRDRFRLIWPKRIRVAVVPRELAWRCRNVVVRCGMFRAASIRERLQCHGRVPVADGVWGWVQTSSKSLQK